MSWPNSSIITDDLFLDLELIMHDRIRPSLQGMFNLNEIVELVVLKENLLITSLDFIILVNALNEDKSGELEKMTGDDWVQELVNPGKGNLRKPIILSLLDEEGILVYDTGEAQNKEYKELGKTLWGHFKKGEWSIKTPVMSASNIEKREELELGYVKGFNKSFKYVSSDPLYWKMAILGASYVKYKKQFGPGLSWVYEFYEQVQPYTDFAKRNNLGFSDTILMHPFVSLSYQPSVNFIEIFYRNLKDLRNEQIQEVLELQQPWTYHLPPLTSILLQRCKSRDDLPIELIKLRREFRFLRESLAKYQREFEEAQTIREKMDLKRDFQTSMDLFARKTRGRRKRIAKILMDFAIGQSDALIRKDFSGPISVIIGKFADYLYSKRICPWMNTFLDLYDRSLRIGPEATDYEKIFGKVNFNYSSEFQLFAQNSQKFLELHKKHTRK